MNLPNLNLLNFELPQSRNCKYVLTSPRSLKACRKAGIKPVDLLYKSLKDVERESGKEGAQDKFQAYEKERQRKLGICRRLRNELLLKGCNIKQNSTNKDAKISGKTSPKLSEENLLPAIPCSDHLKKTTECQENFKNMEKVIHFEKINLQPINSPSKSRMNTPNTGQLNETSMNSPLMLEKAAEMNHYELLPKFQSKQPSRSQYISQNDVKESGFTIGKGDKEVEDFHIKNSESSSIKESLDNLEFLKKISPNEKITAESDFLPEIIKKDDIIFEDINNNNEIKIEDKMQRPVSCCKKKIKDKRRSRIADYKKIYDNIKLQYSDPEYCLYKYKQVIENSIDREIREQDVKRVQRQIEEGMERWQDRVLLLQWLDSERAQEQVAREIGTKVERIQQRQRNKVILHTININKVKETEDVKAELLRREIENKNKKILVLQQEKERVICESKSRAHTTSELKEQIRSITTPETFDKKISKFGFEKKVLNQPGLCPRLMQRSHIRLG